MRGEGGAERRLCPVKACRAGMQAWLFSVLGLHGRSWTWRNCVEWLGWNAGPR